MHITIYTHTPCVRRLPRVFFFFLLFNCKTFVPNVQRLFAHYSALTACTVLNSVLIPSLHCRVMAKSIFAKYFCLSYGIVRSKMLTKTENN